MPSVLIVDDDKAFRKQLRALFDRDSGFGTYVEAKNGAEALKENETPIAQPGRLELFLTGHEQVRAGSEAQSNCA